METKIDPFALGHDDKIWVGKILENYELKKKSTYKQLRVDLIDKLSKGYAPYHLSPIIYRGEDEVTLTGIYLYDRKNPFLKRTDEILMDIRSRFIENPNLKKVTSESLSSTCKMAQEHAERCLSLLYHLDIFAAGTNDGSSGIAEFNFGTDRKNIESILSYQSIEKLVQNDMLRHIPKPRNSELEYERMARKKAEKMTFAIGIFSIAATLLSPLIDNYLKADKDSVELVNQSLRIDQRATDEKLDSIARYLSGIKLAIDSAVKFEYLNRGKKNLRSITKE